MKNRYKHVARTILKIAVSAGALCFVLARIDLQELWITWKRSDVSLLIVALLLFGASKLIAAFRLKHFLGAAGMELSNRYNLKLYLLGMFYNLFFPGGVGGDGYKIYLLNRKYRVKTSRIFWSLLIDRISGVQALVILAVIFAYTLPSAQSVPLWKVIWLLVPVSLIVFYLVVRKFFNHFKKIFILFNLHSLAVQGSQVLCALVILTALGHTGNFTGYLLLFLVSSLVAMVPVSIGGAGLRELTFLFGSKSLGLDPDISIALSLMFYFITLVVSFFGIYYSIKGINE